LLMAVCLCLPPVAGAQSQPPGGQYPQGAPPVPPQLLTLPAGTLLMVRTTDLLSSDRNQAGDLFSAILEQPVVAQGWVVAFRGQVVEGRVSEAQPAGHGKGESHLAVELDQLMLVDGNQVPVRTELIQASAGSSRDRDVGIVGATTGTGAVIGGIAGGGTGAAIGAVVGATAGVAGVMATPGRPTEIFPESLLKFRLKEPVTIDTSESQQAFLPVTQQDYYGRSMQNNPPPYPNADVYPPPPAPYYYPYYWGYYPYYGIYAPYGYYGYYGYYGSRGYYYPRGYTGWGYHRGRR